MKSFQTGVWAGVMATGPMTAFLFRMHRKLPSDQQKPLPPAMLTTDFFDRIGLAKYLSSNQRENLALLSHFGYGAACGLIYSLITEKNKSYPLLKGTFFGLGVWGSSYMGWIPALGLRVAASKMSPGRNTMMVLAHVVWGASLGFFENEMRLRQKQMLDGGQHEPRTEK